MFYIVETENRGKGLFIDRLVEQDVALFGTYELNLFGVINHSCSPNCKIKKLGHRHWVCAAQDILSDDELTIDYAEIPFPCQKLGFDCQCGAPNCRGRITL